MKRINHLAEFKKEWTAFLSQKGHKVTVTQGRDSVLQSTDNDGKSFRWLPGVDAKLAKPAGTVSFTAVQFGGNGHGAIYEPINRSIWLDTLLAST